MEAARVEADYQRKMREIEAGRREHQRTMREQPAGGVGNPYRR
jgi:hypothetical protein